MAGRPVIRRRKAAEAPPEPRPRLVLRRVLTPIERLPKVDDDGMDGLILMRFGTLKKGDIFFLHRAGERCEFVKISRTEGLCGSMSSGPLTKGSYVLVREEPEEVPEEIVTVQRGDLVYEADPVEFCQLRGRQRFYLDGHAWTRYGPMTALLDQATSVTTFHPQQLVHRLVR